jgi:hypothetical protein
MIRMILASLLLSVSLVASSKTMLLEHMPLQWRPTSDLRLGTTQMAVSPVMVATFTDGRDNKEVIGENTEDHEPKPVTTTDDVGASRREAGASVASPKPRDTWRRSS